MATKGKILSAVVALSGKVDPQLSKAMQDVEKKLDGVNVKAVAVGAAIGTALAVGVGKGVKYLAELGDSYNTALNDIQMKTGATSEEMKAFDEVLKNVYRAGYGESFEDVANGVAEVSRATQLSGKDLEEVTEGAFALQKAFDYDVSESARAAKAMITNFGISGQDAFNLITAGAQNGLDYSDELIDSVNEYSVQFAKLGFSADDMFQVFQAGADSGAWNLDKVGDAVKEFSIRSIDGSNTSREAFEALGYNADEMFEIFTRGGDDASGAFSDVMNKLMDMDDKVARDAAGVGLFGTMWEDLGTEAMQALADMENGAYATGSELSNLQDLQFDNLGSAFESIKRNLEVGLLPAATGVANILQDAAPKIGEAFEAISPIITSVADALVPVFGLVVDFATAGIGFLADHIGILAPAIAGLVTVLGLWKVAQLLTTAAVTAGTVAEGAAITTTTIWSGVSAVASTATTALGTAFRFLTGPIGIIITVIGAVVAAGVALYKNWDVVKEKAQAVGEFLVNTWNSIKEALTPVIEGIKNVFESVFGTIVNIVKAPINTIISIINGVIGGINSISIDIPDWSPIFPGKHIGFNIPEIPLLATGGFTDGPSIAGEAGTEAVISFDPAYRRENLAYWAKAGQMLGADAADYSLALDSGRNTVVDVGGVSFSPQIVIKGNADKNDIVKAIRDEYPEFLDMLEEWLSGRGELVYG